MTLASRFAAHLPEGLLVRLISLAYRRFEPEIRRADEVCGRGGTMVDIGGWYGPWARRLVRRADRVVVIEPTPLHEVLSRTLPPAVDVIGAAASDSDGEAEIWLPSRGRCRPRHIVAAPAGHPPHIRQGPAGDSGRPRPAGRDVHENRRGRA